MMTPRRTWQEIKARGRKPVHVFVAERDGKEWFLKARDLERVYTQVRRLDQAVEATKDVTALMLGEDPDSFDVVIRIGGELGAVVDRVRAARHQLEQAKVYLAAAQQEAIEQLLVREGLPLRDIGLMVGLSHQRVAQIADVALPRPEPASIEQLMAALEAAVREARNARQHPEREVALQAEELLEAG